jgi:Flp pilus assembly pilin Flp
MQQNAVCRGWKLGNPQRVKDGSWKQNCSLDAGPSGQVKFFSPRQESKNMQVLDVLRALWRDDSGQDIAEYAVMLAVILVIVVGTIRLVGSNANNVFSETASSLGG